MSLDAILKSRRTSAATILLLLLALLIAPCAKVEYLGWKDTANFDAKTSDATVLGKSVDQVIALLGKPDLRDKDANGSERIWYHSELGRCCIIDFVGGVATKINRWSK